MRGITLMHGDCLELMKDIPDGSVDLVVTDPPYKMTKAGKSCRPNYMKNGMGDNFFSGALPDPKIWIPECFRVLKEGTHFYTFCNINDIQDYLNIAKDTGFLLHNILPMIKQNTRMPNRWYWKSCEFILFFRKGKAKPINNPKSRDCFFVNMPTKKESKVHPTEKPFEVIATLVTNSSDPDDVVFDPFMGSGTAGAACVQNGRRFIGIELDKGYFDIARDRITKIQSVL